MILAAFCTFSPAPVCDQRLELSHSLIRRHGRPLLGKNCFFNMYSEKMSFFVSRQCFMGALRHFIANSSRDCRADGTRLSITLSMRSLGVHGCGVRRRSAPPTGSCTTEPVLSRLSAPGPREGRGCTSSTDEEHAARTVARSILRRRTRHSPQSWSARGFVVGPHEPIENPLEGGSSKSRCQEGLHDVGFFTAPMVSICSSVIPCGRKISEFPRPEKSNSNHVNN